jgi:hypothetical protein
VAGWLRRELQSVVTSWCLLRPQGQLLSLPWTQRAQLTATCWVSLGALDCVSSRERRDCGLHVST